MKLSVFLLVMFFSMNASGFQLSKYRGADADKHIKAVQKQASAVLKLLGKEGADVSHLPNPDPSAYGQSLRIGSSILIKVQMGDVIREIVMREKYGERLVFTPSSTFSKKDVKNKIRDSRNAICREVLEKRASRITTTDIESEDPFESILREVKALSERSNQSKARREAATIPATGEVLGLVEQANVDEQLGELGGLLIQDGSIYALMFNQNEKKRKITLSMIMTFLSGEDDAFIAAMECLMSVLEPKLENAKKKIERHAELTGPIDWIKNRFSSERREEKKGINLEAEKFILEHYTPIGDYVQGKLDGARDYNQVLNSLSRESLAGLFNILIRAQIHEIPSAEELQTLGRTVGELSNAALENGEREKGEELSADGFVYPHTQRQLSRLQSILEEQQSDAAQAQEIIDTEIRRNR